MANAGLPALALELAGVEFAFGRTPVLANVNLQVGTGEFVSLVGPSGAGKSTLFRLICGLLQPDAGVVRLAGVQAPQRLGRVGYMPQRDCLLPWRTVLGNAAALLELQGVPHREGMARARSMLPEFGLAGTDSQYPDELSGGMRQRLALLRTVLTERQVLLLDEPFGALDALTRSAMQSWLLALWERRRLTVLLITHDVEEAVLLSDRVYTMVPRTGEAAGRSGPFSLSSPMPVSLPRPRHYDMIGDPLCQELRRSLLTTLRPYTTEVV